MDSQESTFRIFVSSTFCDLVAERNALHEHVYPRLREYCRKNGARFQAIDLRWGISSEAGLDQSTMRICRSEIARCQVVSPRPNFLVLLGNRHGWRPLPDEISSSEFELLLPQLPTDLAARWYRLDENAVCDGSDKGVYILQPRTGEFAEGDRWSLEVEGPLGEALRRAARIVGLTEEFRRKYEASATAQEIQQGAFGLPDAQEHVAVFIREIVTANSRPLAAFVTEIAPSTLPADSALRNFLDFKSDTSELDHESQEQLVVLKKRLCDHLGPERIKTYSATWTGNGIDTRHLGPLCIDVYRMLRRLISTQLKRLDNISPFESERFHQREFVRRCVRDFTGQNGPLAQIAGYLSPTDPPTAPLVLSGVTGSGKSALMAKAITDYETQTVGTEPVFRFIGATAASTDLRSLLEGLCRELGQKFGLDDTELPLDLAKLIALFHQRLELASVDKPLILFVDALDQLQPANRPDLTWLPVTVPPHVRLVVSCLIGPTLESLRFRIPSARLLKLGPMLPEDVANVLDKWLQLAGRRLKTEKQRRLITAAIAGCSLPLYLRLVFEEVRQWRSYDQVSSPAPDVDGMIERLFTQLTRSLHHEELLVDRVIGYLRCSRYGLSEDEILDLLARDDEYWETFLKSARHRLPLENGIPTRRLPTIIWSRLFHDLEPYLAWRSAAGTALLGFFHTRFNEVADQRFLSDNTVRSMRHAALANYFHMLAAPDELWDSATTRSVEELAYHTASAGRFSELANYLSDIGYLDQRTRLGDVFRLVSDYAWLPREWAATASEYGDFLRHHAQRLMRYRGSFFSLLYHEGFSSAREQVAIRADQRRQRRPWICLTQAWMPPLKPAGDRSVKVVAQWEFLRDSSQSAANVGSLAVEKSLAFFSNRLGSIGAVDLISGRKLVSTISTPRSRILALACSPNGQLLVAAFENGTVACWQIHFDQDEFLAQQQNHGHFDYFLPEFEAPALAIIGGLLWFQNASGALVCVDPVTGGPATHRLELGSLNGAPSEVSAISAVGDIVVVATRRTDASTLWAIRDGAILGSHDLKSSEVRALTPLANGRIAAALNNFSVELYQVGPCFSSERQLQVGDVHEIGRGGLIKGSDMLCQLSASGETLYGVTTNGHLLAWQSNETASSPIQSSDAELTLPLALAAGENNVLLFLGKVAAARLTVSREGCMQQLPVPAVFAGLGPPGEYTAVQETSNGIALVDSRDRSTQTRITGDHSFVIYARDGEGYILGVRTLGQGFLQNREIDGVANCTRIPPGIAAVTGDPNGGFWLVDAGGAIYFQGTRSGIVKLGQLKEEVIGQSRLVCAAGLLIWSGISRAGADYGFGDVYALHFYRIRGPASSPLHALELLGVRIIDPVDGLLDAIAWDEFRNRLICVFSRRYTHNDLVCVGSVEEYLECREGRMTLSGTDKNVRDVRVRPTDGIVQLLTERGTLFCLDGNDFRVLAVLNASKPFTHLSADFAADGSSFLVDDYTQVRHCRFENGDLP